MTNERAHLLEARQTLIFDLETMFGPGATAGTVASVAIESKNDRSVATKIGTAAGGAYAVDSQAPVEPAYFPFDRRSAREMPLVSVASAGTADFESGGCSWIRPAWSRRPPCGRPPLGVRCGVPWMPCSASRPRRCR